MSVAAFTVALMLATGPAPTNRLLERGTGQVQRLQEKEAVRTLELARGLPTNTPEQLAQCYLWLGLAYAGLNQPGKAKESFHAALLLEPELVLPPHPSPRIVEWFTESGGKAAPASPAPAPPAPPETVVPVPPETHATEPVVLDAVAKPTVSTAAPHRGSPGLRTAGIVLGSAGVAALAVGIFFGTRSSGFSGQASSERDLTTAAAAHADAVHAAQTANAFYLAGGVAALGGAGMIAFSF